MHYCVLLVVENPDQSWEVMEAWQAAGAGGITILDTSETAAERRADTRRTGLIPSLEALLRGQEARHRTLFSIVRDESQAQRLVEAARSVIGEFDEERTGLVIVLPVSRVYGLRE